MNAPVLRPTYEKVIEKVDNLTRFFYIAMVKVTLTCVTMPNFLISFYFYFADDSSADAFRLPFPVW